jgi:hypothetical protein
MVRLMGLYRRDDHQQRLRYRRRLVVLLTVIPAGFYFLFQSPVQMVVVGGMAQSIMLPVAALGTAYLRHRHLPPAIRPSLWMTAALWAAVGVISAFMITYLAQTLR